MSVDLEHELGELLRKEKKLPAYRSNADYDGGENMDWIRAALVVLLKAERARMLEGSG